MLLDFTPIREKKTTWVKFAQTVNYQDLAELTNAAIDHMLDMMADCVDADVTFVPVDLEAHDPYAENPDEEDIAWTLGHVIVHVTASLEESVFLAAELARGVEMEPRRSRYETPWETVSTIEECRARLEESRRMALASLEMWPDEPHLENFYNAARSGMEIRPVLRYILGLSHADDHYGHLVDIVSQAKTERG